MPHAARSVSTVCSSGLGVAGQDELIVPVGR